nr:hypothetical protein CFP56_14928 [Quercus suber]
MVCHPNVLPQSSTSSSSIRPINLQPTANQASHLISSTDPPYPQTEASISFLRPPICHIQPLQPRNGPPFAVGLIKPMPTIPTNIEQTMAHQLRRSEIHPTQPKGLLLLPFSSLFSSIRIIRVKECNGKRQVTFIKFFSFITHIGIHIGGGIYSSCYRAVLPSPSD